MFLIFWGGGGGFLLTELWLCCNFLGCFDFIRISGYVLSFSVAWIIGWLSEKGQKNIGIGMVTNEQILPDMVQVHFR